MTDWSDVETAVKAVHDTYFALLAERGEGRAGTKKLAKLETAFYAAHAQRAAALAAHWTEEDGYIGEDSQRALGPVLQRYYGDRYDETKKVKR